MKNRIYPLIIALIITVVSLSCSSEPGAKLPSLNSYNYDYGIVYTNETKEFTFVFKNTYSLEVRVTSAILTGDPEFSITSGASGMPKTILPNSTHEVIVQFAPQALQPYLGWFELTYEDPQFLPQTLKSALHGEGLQANAFSIDVTGTPPTYDFGVASTTNPIEHTFTVTNMDTGNNLEISNIQITGAAFSLQSGFGSPEIIAPLATFQIIVRFSPPSVSQFTGTMEITHNDVNTTSPFVVDLKGEGIIPPAATYNVSQNASSPELWDQVTRFGPGFNTIWKSSDGYYDDDCQLIDLTFTFEYFGISFTQVYVSVNGFLAFTDPGNGNGNNAVIPANGLPNNVIAVFWDDIELKDFGGNGSEDTVKYEVTGVAPNRTLIAEWESVTVKASSTWDNFLYFGVQLFETTNVIEMYYTTSTLYSWTWANVTGSCGIENLNGTSGYNGIPGSPNINNRTQLVDYTFTPN